MVGNPHTTCSQLLDNLRSSGLTFTLNETPYSVYLTVRKKFTKEYSPSNHAPPIGEHEASKCAGADVLAQLLQDEINNHNVTKFELSETDDKLRRSVECNIVKTSKNIKSSTSARSPQLLSLRKTLQRKLTNMNNQKTNSESLKQRLTL